MWCSGPTALLAGALVALVLLAMALRESPRAPPPPANTRQHDRFGHVHECARGSSARASQSDSPVNLVLVTELAEPALMGSLRELVGSLHYARRCQHDEREIAARTHVLVSPRVTSECPRCLEEIALWSHVATHAAPSTGLARATDMFCRALGPGSPALGRDSALVLVFAPLSFNMTVTLRAAAIAALREMPNSRDAGRAVRDPVTGVVIAHAPAVRCNGALPDAVAPVGNQAAALPNASVSYYLYRTPVLHAKPSYGALHILQREPWRGFHFCFLALAPLRVAKLRLDSERADARAWVARAHGSGRLVIALGAPTVGSMTGSALLSVLVPSVIATIAPDERARFSFRFYVGYDRGDVLWDGSHSHWRRNAERILHAALGARADLDVRAELIALPATNAWMTALWGALFSAAEADGADYFFQVNDDLELTSTRWASACVDALRATRGVGVTGPYDPRQKGAILTQAFVDVREHSRIFDGRLYPLELKDWYSDTWLSEVYMVAARARRAHVGVADGFSARNLNNRGTRYTACSMPRYDEALERGRATVARALNLAS